MQVLVCRSLQLLQLWAKGNFQCSCIMMPFKLAIKWVTLNFCVFTHLRVWFFLFSLFLIATCNNFLVPNFKALCRVTCMPLYAGVQNSLHYFTLQMATTPENYADWHPLLSEMWIRKMHPLHLE